MSDSAFKKVFLEETISAFEKNQTLTRHTVTTKSEINGNEATFLVAGSGGASAVTRGKDGDIPSRPDDLNQYTATLKEWYDKPKRSGFNVFASQGDGGAIMQRTARNVINRQIDKDVHTALATGTQTLTHSVASFAAFMASNLTVLRTLGENSADEGELFALITPGYYANLMTLKQFTSADYIKSAPFEKVAKSRAFNWNGINYIVDQGLPGMGGASAQCYFYNKEAVGHACDMERFSAVPGFNEENNYSYVLAKTYMGSKLLQNSGVLVVSHDDNTILTS